MEPREVVRSGYNAIPADYLAVLDHAEDSDPALLLQELVGRLPRDAKVLDAGRGAGVPVTLSLSLSFEVIGVNFAEAQIELARRLVPGARFVCQDNDRSVLFRRLLQCGPFSLRHHSRPSRTTRLLESFHRMLKPEGLALVWTGTGDLQCSIEEGFCGSPMYWSHYDVATNLTILRECGFRVLWSKLGDNHVDPRAKHLFALAQKS